MLSEPENMLSEPQNTLSEPQNTLSQSSNMLSEASHPEVDAPDADVASAPALSTALRPLPAITAAMAAMSEQELEAAMRALEDELAASAQAAAPGREEDEPSDG